jgi:hypothetical protein
MRAGGLLWQKILRRPVMTTPPEFAPASGDVPYADAEPFDEMIQECRCAQAECEAHRVGAGPGQSATGGHPEPVSIDDNTQHLVDGYSDYGG